MNLRKKVSAIINQDYFFSVISKVLGVFLAIIYSAFYNRYLGTVLKGDAAIISNYISLISSFTALGRSGPSFSRFCRMGLNVGLTCSS